jgi:hypothetical protein
MGVHLPSKRTVQRGSLRASLAFLAIALGLGVTTGVAPSGAIPSRSEPTAIAARTLLMNVTGKLHLVSRVGRVLNHRGSLTGSISGPVSTRSIALASNHGEGTFTFYPKGGSISGRATSYGRVVGAAVYFTGISTITGGTGIWAHASGKNLRFTGVLDRQNLSVTEHFVGSIRY